jgi:tight adherence protein B
VLVDLGLPFDPAVVAGAWLAMATLLGAWVLAQGGGLMAVGMAEAVFGGISLTVCGTLRVRVDRLRDAAVPLVLETVARELRAGASLPEVLRHLAGRTGPLSADIQAVCRRADLGLGWASAIRGWARTATHAGSRSSSKTFGAIPSAAAALALAHDVGGPAANPLDALAVRLRRQQAMAAEVRALSTQGRWSAWVVILLPAVALAVSAAADPATTSALTATEIGRLCLIGGMALDGLGAWWMHTILRRAR